MSRDLNFCEPLLAPGTAEALAAVVERNFLNEGQETRRFESLVAEACGTSHAIAVTSGTTALFLALMAVGVGPGDEVIAPDLTYVASVNAIRMAGATPVLADVQRDRLGLDPAAVERAITPRTKAILPVHVSGRGAPMPELLEVARRHRLRVVEDSAEALGSVAFGKALGSHGDAGIFSFSPNKTISCGQGGIVITNDDTVARRIRELKNQGRVERATGGADEHPTFGVNFKFTDLQAAVANLQMPDLPRRAERLRNHYRIYRAELEGVPGIHLPHFDVDAGETPCWVDAQVDGRDSLADYLIAHRAFPRKLWFPVHHQKPYARPDDDFPVSVELSYKGLWLPSALTLDDADIRYVSALIREWVAQR